MGPKYSKFVPVGLAALCFVIFYALALCADETQETQRPPLPHEKPPLEVMGPLFNPIAMPDDKKENPTVLDLSGSSFQVDLVRVPFKAFDLIEDNQGELLIVVIEDRRRPKLDEAEMKKILEYVKKISVNKLKEKPVIPPPPLGPSQVDPGMVPGRAVGRPANETNARRSGTEFKFIPVESLEYHMKKGAFPAMTIVPWNAAIIHVEIPYKKQIEEIKRALHLATDVEAKANGPIYDGYEVQRRVTVASPSGEIDIISDWADYKFEDRYQKNVSSRRLADTLEDGFLPYFIRYDMAMALPLPELVSELGKYPNFNKLENINNGIKKLKEAGVKPITPSMTVTQLRNRIPRNELYIPHTGSENGTSALFGVALPGIKVDANSKLAIEPVDVDHLLLRFVDTEVKPGFTYQYRIRLRMLNPNFKREKVAPKQNDGVVEILKSKWTEFHDPITIPPEHHLYASDVSSYHKAIEDAYPTQKDRDLRYKLQVKDDQAVIEICRWLPKVKADGGRREPVGGWVVADFPVGRGEFIGRNTFVNVPLWSSDTNSFALRDVSSTFVKNKETLPKGCLVNFTTADILVDFWGGKVRTKQPSRTITEDIPTEMLIVSKDGTLSVRKSLADAADPNRRHLSGIWTRWIADAEKRKANPKPGDDFAPKP